MNIDRTDYRAGFVALLGMPNAGKSTLMNVLVGEKVAIVSAKPQTTRQRMLSLWSSEKDQIILVDAPGWVYKARHHLHEYLQEEFKDAMKGSDALVLVVSADERDREASLQIWELALSLNKPLAVVVSKAATVKAEHLTEIVKFWNEKCPSTHVVSALENPKGTQKSLHSVFRAMLPVSTEPLYDLDSYTVHPVRELAAEIVREKCFELLRQEIPYGIGVDIQRFEEAKDITRIEADIWVSKHNHKGMVIGSGASMLKNIGTQARIDMEKLLYQKVFLKLNVKVKEDWTHSQSRIRDLGYVQQRELS